MDGVTRHLPVMGTSMAGLAQKPLSPMPFRAAFRVADRRVPVVPSASSSGVIRGFRAADVPCCVLNLAATGGQVYVTGRQEKENGEFRLEPSKAE